MQHADVVSGLGSHTLSFEFVPTQSGLFRLQVVSLKECPYCDALPANSFWDIAVKPAVYAATTLDAAFTETAIIAGDCITVSGRSFDAYGNVVLAPQPPSPVQCVVRLNGRALAGVSSRVFLSANFYVACAVVITTAGAFQLSMMSFQSKSYILNHHLNITSHQTSSENDIGSNLM